MRRFWPFKRLANFAFTVFIGGGITTLYLSTKKDRIFSGNPIITQSIKLMNQNTTLKNLLGYPLSYNGAWSNTYNYKQNEKYYYFEVRGSKQKVFVQLIASKKKVSQIRNSINNIISIKQNILKCQNQIKSLQNNRFDINKKWIRSHQLQQQLSSIQQNIILLQNQLFDLKHQKDKLLTKYNQSLIKYYIPQLDLYAKSLKNQSPQQLINDNQSIYAIQQLIANLPNQNKFNILKSNNKQQQKQKTNKQPIIQSNQLKYQKIIFNEGYLRTRIRQGLGQLSEEEIQSYGKHKTQMMYTRAQGSQKLLFMLGFCLTGFFSIKYFHDNRIQSIAGTTIEYTAQKFFRSNLQKYRPILQKLKIQQNKLKFNQLYLGGKTGKYFKCTVDINGFPNAQVTFQGKQSSTNINFDQFYLQYQDGQSIKKIDLLA